MVAAASAHKRVTLSSSRDTVAVGNRCRFGDGPDQAASEILRENSK
jgi:hypothetical protein